MNWSGKIYPFKIPLPSQHKWRTKFAIFCSSHTELLLFQNFFASFRTYCKKNKVRIQNGFWMVKWTKVRYKMVFGWWLLSDLLQSDPSILPEEVNRGGAELPQAQILDFRPYLIWWFCILALPSIFPSFWATKLSLRKIIRLVMTYEAKMQNNQSPWSYYHGCNHFIQEALHSWDEINASKMSTDGEGSMKFQLWFQHQRAGVLSINLTSCKLVRCIRIFFKIRSKLILIPFISFVEYVFFSFL